MNEEIWDLLDNIEISLFGVQNSPVCYNDEYLTEQLEYAVRNLHKIQEILDTQ